MLRDTVCLKIYKGEDRTVLGVPNGAVTSSNTPGVSLDYAAN